MEDILRFTQFEEVANAVNNNRFNYAASSCVAYDFFADELIKLNDLAIEGEIVIWDKENQENIQVWGFDNINDIAILTELAERKRNKKIY